MKFPNGPQNSWTDAGDSDRATSLSPHAQTGRYLKFAEPVPASNPERLVVVIDVSWSMDANDWTPSRLHGAKEAASALIRRKLETNPEDEIGLVTFSGSAKVLCPLVRVGGGHQRLRTALHDATVSDCTSITAGLRKAESLLFPDRVSSLWDQLVSNESVSTKAKKLGDFLDRLLSSDETTASKANVQPRIVLLTDGHDNHSRVSPEVVAHTLKKQGTCIDVIGIGGSPDEVDETQLREIASPTLDGQGVRYAFIGDRLELIQRFEQLAGRITR